MRRHHTHTRDKRAQLYITDPFLPYEQEKKEETICSKVKTRRLNLNNKNMEMEEGKRKKRRANTCRKITAGGRGAHAVRSVVSLL